MVRMVRRIGIVWLWLALTAAAVGAELHVYHPKHRTAEGLLPIVEVALSEGGSVAVDSHSNALVLVGSSTEIAQALELLALQDRPLRTVLIEHETRTARELEASGVRIRWSAGGQPVQVGNIAPGPGGSRVSVRLGEDAQRADGSQTGTLRVLEGAWGRISSGNEALLPIGSARFPNAVRVAAQSGLEVRPRILGDGRVRLDLRPFQASLGRGGSVSHSGADTTLVVTPGETAVVGSLGGSRSERSASRLSGAGQRQQETQQLLLVTVTIDGAAAR